MKRFLNLLFLVFALVFALVISAFGSGSSPNPAPISSFNYTLKYHLDSTPSTAISYQTAPVTSTAIPINLTGFYDFTGHQMIAAAFVPVSNVPNFLFNGWTLTIGGFVGATVSGKSAFTGGTAVGMSHGLGGINPSLSAVNFTVGLGEAVYTGGAIHTVGFVGISGTLGSIK